jgi:hypothetical protein
VVADRPLGGLGLEVRRGVADLKRHRRPPLVLEQRRGSRQAVTTV